MKTSKTGLTRRLQSERLEDRYLLSGTPELVVDINQAVTSPSIHSLTDANGSFFFVFDEPGSGQELWTSDGTVAGTRLVKDIRPGPDSSYPGQLSVVNGRLFFSAQNCTDSVCSPGLWTSDGTEQGTVELARAAEAWVGIYQIELDGSLLFTLQSASTSGLWKTDGTIDGTVEIASVRNDGFDQPTLVNGTLLFTSSEGSSLRLWASDGTPDGTIQIADLGNNAYASQFTVGGEMLYFSTQSCSQTCSVGVWSTDGTQQGTQEIFSRSNAYPGQLAVVNETVFFSTETCTNTCTTTLWSTDGTPDGVIELTSVRDGGVYNLYSIGDTVVFTVSSASGTQRLWASDGTVDGTAELINLRNGYGEWATSYDGKLFLAVYTGNSAAIWATDGTTEGTFELSDFGRNSYVQNISVLRGALFISVQSCSDTCTSTLLTSDGTTGGTREIYRDASGGYVSPPMEVGGDLLLSLQYCDNTCSTRLLKSDGTREGTVVVKQFDDLGEMTRSADKLFMVARDGRDGNRLWVTDGTADGTAPLTEIGQRTQSAFGGCYGNDFGWFGGPGCSSQPGFLFAQDGILYLAAQDEQDGPTRLWKSDGTAAGTDLVSDVQVQSPDRDDNGRFEIRTAPYFVARDEATGRELWTTDGTRDGTRLVKDIRPGPDESYPRLLASVGDIVFFTAYDENYNSVLWGSDGTEAGTRPLTETYVDSYGRRAAVLGDELYFATYDEQHGDELWKSDGTEQGTVLVADIVPGPDGSNPQNLTSASGRLFFTVYDNADGTNHVWVLDDAEAGAPQTRNLTSGSGIQYVNQIFAADTADTLVYFEAYTEQLGRELWVTDGSQSGTHLVKDVDPGTDGSYPTALAASGDILFFAAQDRTNGRELWITDGTEDGTQMVKDIAPGQGDSYPERAIEFRGDIYFTADDQVHGMELWTTDGTDTGTALVADINPGQDSSYAESFVALDEALFFLADDGLHGKELWSMGDIEPRERFPADLSVTNTSDGSNFSPGQLVTYTVTVSNQGPENVTGALVTDALPAELIDPSWTCAATEGSRCAATGAGDVADTIDLLAGGSATYAVTAMLDPQAAPGTLLSTRAAVTTPNGVPDLVPSNSVRRNTAVIQQVEATWDGNSAVGEPGDGVSWNDAANWSIGLVLDVTPGNTNPGANVTFADASTPATIDLGIDRNVNGLRFQSDYTLSGYALTVGTGDISVADDATATIHSTLVAPQGLTKTGDGTLAVDTLVGGAAVEAGTLVVTGNAGAIVVNGGVLNGSGTLDQLTVGPAGTVALGANSAFSVTGRTRIEGILHARVSDVDALLLDGSGLVRIEPGSVLRLQAAGPVGEPGPEFRQIVRGSSIRGRFADVPHQHIGFGVFTDVTQSASSALVHVGSSVWANLIQAAPGDANGDGRFNQLDLVQVLRAGKLFTGQPADWTEGDWNGDGVFDQRDVIAAIQTETYLAGTDLLITNVSGASAVSPGHLVTRTITVTNEGPLEAVNAAVTEILPAELIDATWTCTAAEGSSCSAAGEGAVVDTINLPVGGSVTYVTTAILDPQATPGDTLTTHVSVRTPNGLPDVVPANNVQRETIDVLPVDVVWDGNAAVGQPGDAVTWNDGANWSIGLVQDVMPGNTAPGADITFADAPTVGTVELGEDRTARTLHFDAGYVLDGHSLTLTDGTIAVAEDVTATIHAELRAPNGLIKRGAGTLVVDALVGDAVIEAGKLVVGGSAADVTVQAGTLVVNGAAGDVDVEGGTLSGSGSVQAVQVGPSGVIAPDAHVSLSVDGAVRLEGTFLAKLANTDSPRLVSAGRVQIEPGSVLRLQAVESLGTPGEKYLQLIDGRFMRGRFPDIPHQHIGFGVFTANAFSTDSALVHVGTNVWINLRQAAPGDANGDGRFDQRDVVQVLQAAKYLTGEPADWTEGDWNGDGVFDQSDIIAARQTESFAVTGNAARSEMASLDAAFAEL